MIRPKETATRLIVVGNSLDELKLISNRLKFRPEGYWRSPSYERFKITEGEDGWDGWIRPMKLDFEAMEGIVPRGYKDMILEFCRSRGIEVIDRDLLVSPFAHLALEDIPLDMLPGITLDEYQQRCLHGWLRHGIGICNVTVSGGKTATFAGAARMIKDEHPDGRILYVTQSERLVRQAYTEMKKFLPGLHITRYGGGARGSGKNKETGQDYSGRDMVVATMAVLHRNVNKLIEEKFFRTFIAVFYDEVHHAASKSSQALLSVMPSYYRLGASDTKKESNKSKWNAILSHFGAVRSVTEASPLIQIGRVARPNHYLVDIQEWQNVCRDIPYRAQPGTPAIVLEGSTWKKAAYLGPVYQTDARGKLVYRKVRELAKEGDCDARGNAIEVGEWMEVKKPIPVPGVQLIRMDGEEQEIESRWCLLNRAYDRAIIRFQERNKLITEWACHFSAQGHQTLVVCTRTLHIYILEALIRAAHPEPEKVEILFGWATGAQRDKMFEWFKNTPGSVLITPLVKEGVSINEIRAGVVADHVADWEVANQITGRFMRKKPDGTNEAEIVWFVDRQHPTMRRNNIKVIEQLENINGYNFYHPLAGPESLKHALEYKTPDLAL